MSFFWKTDCEYPIIWRWVSRFDYPIQICQSDLISENFRLQLPTYVMIACIYNNVFRKLDLKFARAPSSSIVKFNFDFSVKSFYSVRQANDVLPLLSKNDLLQILNTFSKAIYRVLKKQWLQILTVDRNTQSKHIFKNTENLKTS